MITVDIDKSSGFCFGVKKAIEAASQLLSDGERVYCVGDIVHNEAESTRLNQLGMRIIEHNDLEQLQDGTVLFRAHGEPPATYDKIKASGLKLQDATCPVVLKLQQRIRQAYLEQKTAGGQIVIFGKPGHAEVIGLMGQTEDEAIIIESETDIHLIDAERPVEIFAQTTKDPDKLARLVKLIQTRCHNDVKWHNTTCKQVTGRVPRIKEFAKAYSAVVFVGGKKSSNARVLFDACKQVNPNSFFVSSAEDVRTEWFNPDTSSVGVCGATSTPNWLMEQVANYIRTISMPR
ncbi:4-hydroxy-3-methylbut-2-enyl diphosphate reductase [Carboxylicivirga sediminis]|uniref:4-hydroxy-3-methylbut-2-enyl diphosphate reductase n=1 Tax=Carboxylicivirga sediminis TaxID=2006564 RepID=A0A941F629_9BACT|nr:4-hydroxy-3-methylbut-2-enyl diphosphate reductase [Carboxylicivirga sediminis]MBR8537099.1 4-hydroxy-3-methylbut-2-enyl diphosphate reductase [Carboxylicivirga sediminis]